MNLGATFVFVLLFIGVTILGFRRELAARRSRPSRRMGPGGRRFGTIVTWFLLGGDLYTAYTFVAGARRSAPARWASSRCRTRS
jgi:SSS family solute:Na+ symporter